MELALEVKFISTFTDFTRPWWWTLTRGSDVKCVFPRCLVSPVTVLLFKLPPADFCDGAWECGGVQRVQRLAALVSSLPRQEDQRGRRRWTQDRGQIQSQFLLLSPLLSLRSLVLSVLPLPLHLLPSFRPSSFLPFILPCLPASLRVFFPPPPLPSPLPFILHFFFPCPLSSTPPSSLPPANKWYKSSFCH